MMSHQANVNKDYAIKKLQKAIKTARTLLEVPGQSDQYYDWHNKTIELNKQSIEKIIKAPITVWN